MVWFRDCVCVCVCSGGKGTQASEWRSKDNFQELVLSFDCVGLQSQSLIVRLDDKYLCMRSHLADFSHLKRDIFF